jgi:predicted transcriptional regulator
MRDLTAKDIMNTNVMTVQEEMSVQALSAFLSEEEISGAPVVNSQGNLVGVVSVTDIAEEGREHTWVRDIMTPTIFTIPEETPVSKIAKTMIAGRIHRLLVTHKGKVVGIVTALDMLKLLSD